MNEKYIIRFWFEHGGICLWSANTTAHDKYGYPIENKKLPISSELIDKLNNLEAEYHTYLDWDYPPNPSSWSKEHKEDFIKRATNVYDILCNELGYEYEVINDVRNCCK